MRKSKFLSTLLVLTLSIILSACGQPNDTNQADDNPDENTAANQIDSPQFRAEKFTNNHRYGPTNGCRGIIGLTGNSKCGHPDAVSEITWEFIKHVDGKDIYIFQRRFPIEATINRSLTSQTTTEEKTIEYTGEEMIIFEDEFQRISLIPVQEDSSGTAAAD